MSTTNLHAYYTRQLAKITEDIGICNLILDIFHEYPSDAPKIIDWMQWAQNYVEVCHVRKAKVQRICDGLAPLD